MEIYCREKGIPVPPPKDNGLQFGRTAAEKPISVKPPVSEESKDTSAAKEESTAPENGFAKDDEDEDSYFTKQEETCYGISKSELDELNEIVDEEIKKEEQKALEEQKPEDQQRPEEKQDDGFDEFQDILNKRAEGKNDEVE